VQIRRTLFDHLLQQIAKVDHVCFCSSVSQGGRGRPRVGLRSASLLSDWPSRAGFLPAT
jgi:hypothetical protein